MTKMEAGSHISTQWQIHYAGTSWAVALAHPVWTPLAVAFFGAAGGGLISAWAIFRNGSEEWQRKQAEAREALQQKKAQSRRALQIEMLMNAQRLQTAANVGGRMLRVDEVPREAPAEFHKLLSGRDFSAAFRTYFIDAMDGVAWMDIDCVLDAYDMGGTVV
ncbi:hypothetical protein [Acidiferrobacter sp.]|uniref:hypothetical protein n=1 Tax=Acidiferrobacter sp. TaxID=1872107 RepID=UPI00262B9CEE|nr:hypothetical protein [Acidiferrobacter sp.]